MYLHAARRMAVEEARPEEPPAAPAMPDLRVAIVHDWCPDFRGGERVLARLCRLFPDADVFTLFDFLDPEVKARHFPGRTFRTSPLNRLPGVRRYYRSLFALCRNGLCLPQSANLSGCAETPIALVPLRWAIYAM